MLRSYHFAIFFSILASISAQCGPGSVFSSEQNKCFQYFNVAVDYNTAESICTASLGHVASVHNEIDNNFMAQLAQSPVWLGATASAQVDNNWKWSDSSDFDYQNYKSGEPSHLKNSACMVFQTESSKWQSAGCNEKYPFICAYEPNDQPAVTCPPEKSHNCPSGYYWFQETDACYKPVIENVNAANASTICEKEGAHLASIHSQVENDFLVDITRTGLNVSDPHYYNGLYIGFIYVNGAWVWSDGTPRDFTNWARGEPNNMGFEWSAAILPDPGTGGYNPDGGQWNNVDKEQRGYICKRSTI